MAKKPDLQLKAFNKTTGYGKSSQPVGAGWWNDNGTISIRLNPFITLTAAEDLVLTLFPVINPKSPKTTTKYDAPVGLDSNNDISF